MNRNCSTRIVGSGAQVMCEVIQVMKGRDEKRTRKIQEWRAIQHIIKSSLRNCLVGTRAKMNGKVKDENYTADGFMFV